MTIDLWFSLKFVSIKNIRRQWNLTVNLSKFTFHLKILSDITLLKVTPNITWTQPIYIYMVYGVAMVWTLKF